MSKATREKYLGFDDRLLVLLGIPFLSLLIPILFYDTEFTATDYWPRVLVSFFYCSLYWSVSRYFMIRLRRKIPNSMHVAKRLSFFALLMLPFISLTSICGCWMDQEAITISNVVPKAISSIFIAIMVWSIYESIYFFSQYRKIQLEQEKLLREKMQTELASLRNQVNPHFLFNSLNALADLISVDSQRAEQYVQNLSRVYRYILEIHNEELITLDEEMRFLNSYIFLLKTRFGSKLNIQIDVEEKLKGLMIVPLSLQILFENAIKHNIVSESKPLHILVSAKDGHSLEVSNNLQLRTGEIDSTKTGLANLKNRYKLLSNRLVEIIQTGDQFKVRVPILKMESTP